MPYHETIRATASSAAKATGGLLAGLVGIDAAEGNGLDKASAAAGEARSKATDTLMSIFDGLPWFLKPSEIVDAVSSNGDAAGLIVSHGIDIATSMGVV